jgi:hypothetical protein
MELLGTIAAVLFAADGGAPAPTARPTPSLLAPRPSGKRPSPEDSYPLRPAKDGSGDMLYEAPTFTARVAPDGSVAFSSKVIVNLDWLPLVPRRISFAVPSLQSSLEALLGGKAPPSVRPPDDRRPPPETTQVIPEISRYRPDPREGCRECKSIPFRGMPLNVTGRFDLTDELSRMNGTDPHRYEKARFLVATREQRVGMAVRKHAANVRRAAAELPAMLTAIACDDRLSRVDRLAILNALRNDMDVATAEGRDASARIAEVIASYLGPADAGIACPPVR